jgi:hypothetical protein
MLFPSPLVGEGGCDAKHRRRVRGLRMEYPSSGTDFVRATFSHKGRREKEAPESLLTLARF